MCLRGHLECLRGHLEHHEGYLECHEGYLECLEGYWECLEGYWKCLDEQLGVRGVLGVARGAHLECLKGPLGVSKGPAWSVSRAHLECWRGPLGVSKGQRLELLIIIGRSLPVTVFQNNANF